MISQILPQIGYQTVPRYLQNQRRERGGSGNTYNTTCQSTSQQRKAKEQYKARLPSNPTTAITETISLQPGLLNGIDNQHAQRGADAGYPVDEFNVDV